MRRIGFNTIFETRKVDGNMIVEDFKIKQEVVAFYKTILTIYQINNIKAREIVLQNILKLIRHQHNVALHK